MLLFINNTETDMTNKEKFMELTTIESVAKLAFNKEFYVLSSYQRMFNLFNVAVSFINQVITNCNLFGVIKTYNNKNNRGLYDIAHSYNSYLTSTNRIQKSQKYKYVV